MTGCRHRAYLFAGSHLAVLTTHRLNSHIGIVDVTTVIAIKAHPVHLATITNLLFANHRDIVFSLAADHTCIASGTGVKIYGHPPLVALIILMLIPQRLCFGVFDLSREELRLLFVASQRVFANDWTTFHRTMILSTG